MDVLGACVTLEVLVAVPLRLSADAVQLLARVLRLLEALVLLLLLLRGQVALPVLLGVALAWPVLVRVPLRYGALIARQAPVPALPALGRRVLRKQPQRSA